MKTCKKCLITKQYSNFHKSNRCTDGFRGSCKSCVNRDNKERRKRVVRSVDSSGILNIPSQEIILTLFSYREDGNLIYRIPKGSRAAGSVAASGSNQKYVRCLIDGVHYLLHRVIWAYHHGYDEPELDHVDGNPKNNMIGNLRPANRAENTRNQMPIEGGSSIFSGVNWHKRNKKWTARITKGGIREVVGRFDSEIEAGEAVTQRMREVDPVFFKRKIEAHAQLLTLERK